MARIKIQFQPLSEATANLHLDAGSAQVAIAEIRLRKEEKGDRRQEASKRQRTGLGDKKADTRPLNARHVVDLAESIAVLGLLEPIVIDTAGYLLAGGHRLAALQLLAEPGLATRRRIFLERCGWTPADSEAVPNPELAGLADRIAMLGERPLEQRYPKGRIPVQVIDVAGSGDAHLALAVEAAENNVRRQYTNDEIKTLAKRFKAAKYKTTPGKPRKGEKTMLGVLEAAVGRSKRQIQRILEGDTGAKKWDKAVAALRRAAAKVVKAGKRRENEEAKAVIAVAEKVMRAMGV